MAATPEHSTSEEIHPINDSRITYADESTLLAASPGTPYGRVGLATSEDTYWLWTSSGWVSILDSGGDVVGQGTPADNQVVRYHLTTGKIIQPTGLVVDDSDALQMADNQIVRPELKDYGITQNVQASVSGAATINLENGNSHKITVTGNITSMDIQNWPTSGVDGSLTLRVIQGGIGSFTIVWDTSIIWPGGTPPTISTGVGSLDVYVFKSDDAGTTIIGAQIGADFQ